ncbi:MAG: aminoglycoside 6-adenylyltransferase [Lachnospiraceae bacterium]|nr:aminoglycoside 6-adenylyltransferase [Lachnospiraceae bacterium]
MPQELNANKTKERAKDIINIYINAVKKLDFINAVILVGSLSDDTYTGNAGSDIDLVHIVADDKDYITEKEIITDLIDRLKYLEYRIAE